MPGKYNPFRPNSVVSPGMFAGRFEELKIIEQCLSQTKNDNPQHFLIEGERGIGKSSLLLVEYLVATGQIKTLSNTTLNFTTVNLSLEGNDDYYSIIKKISRELHNIIRKKEKFKSISMGVLDFISKIEAGGVRFRTEDKNIDDSELLSLLQDDVYHILTALDKDDDGILILIDEADNAPITANLGLLCKLLTEELTRRQCENLSIGLAGLPRLIQLLRESHQSSPRLFTTIDLKPLEKHERIEVIDRGLEEASEKNWACSP